VNISEKRKESNLELDDEFRENISHGLHKFVHKRGHFFIADAVLAETEVKLVVQQFLVIRSEIKANGNS
jgi:hypothetical protein